MYKPAFTYLKPRSARHQDKIKQISGSLNENLHRTPQISPQFVVLSGDLTTAIIGRELLLELQF